jgi:hypothetical protein
LFNEENDMILCVANAYEQKYYLNPEFSKLPESVKRELKIMCVLYTEDVGGILSLRFDENGVLQFDVTSQEDDFFFDELGSEMKIHEMQKDKQELLQSLTLFYRILVLHEDPQQFM